MRMFHEDDISPSREEQFRTQERERVLEKKRKETKILLEEKRVGPYRTFFEHKGIPMPEYVDQCQDYIFKHDLTDEFNTFKEECGE